MKRMPLEKFINDQLSRWPSACENFRALKDVRTRRMTVGGLEVTVQFNPARIRSTAADVGKEAVKSRKCFLCRENRPVEQIHLRFDGRKSKKYDILVNPYPILAGHLVIASDRHVPQNIWKRYVDMLDLARTYSGCTVFYNGPECGASAPDHFHFQAALRGQMPLECDVDRELDKIRDMSAGETRGKDARQDVLEYLTAVQDAEIFHYRKFVRGVFVMRAATVKSAAKMFYRFLDCVPVRDDGGEPMFNLFSWYSAGEYRSVAVLRSAHRPGRYFADGPERIMISPGCADMAGVAVAPVEADFDRLTPEILGEIYSDVTLSEEAEKAVLWRLTRTQPVLSVGIMSSETITFEILSDGAGPRSASFREGKIEYGGALYDELFFEAQTPSMMFAEPTFVLHGVTIGTDFHWERKMDQTFAGSLKIIVDRDRLTAVNIIGVEDYLLSVVSSEMKPQASVEFLKAHAVISRSWVMARMAGRKHVAERPWKTGPFPEGVDNVPAIVSYLDSVRNPEGGHVCGESGSPCRSDASVGKVPLHIKWYGREEHRLFDVCADDHCQRYQGVAMAVGKNVRHAVDATWGQVLEYGGKICDARFSKCCGGITEHFSTCWEDTDYPYLSSVPDTACACAVDGIGPVADGPDAAVPFCDTSDTGILSQVLNDYDLETKDFFRWEEEYGREELSDIISSRLGMRIGVLLALVPLERGGSGRISLLRVIGTENSVDVGKELEIRKILSRSHLKSSAFEVSYYDPVGMKIPREAVEKSAGEYLRTGKMPAAVFGTVRICGRGWGHGVGLCQIGAAVMASRGYGYRDILSHYYSGASISACDDALENRILSGCTDK